MTRIVPMDKPLSEEDRAYLVMRGEEAKVQWFDDKAARDAEAKATAVETETEEDADDYDKWTVAELQERVKTLNGEGAEIEPASQKKADLIAALREYDALPEPEEEEDQNS